MKDEERKNKRSGQAKHILLSCAFTKRGLYMNTLTIINITHTNKPIVVKPIDRLFFIFFLEQ